MTGYYEQLIEISKDYLGPAAERFIRRQIEFHLEKDPRDLTKEDVGRLAEWIATALSLLTQDKKMVEESGRRIRALVKNNV